MSRRRERRAREQYPPGSRHNSRPLKPVQGNEFVALEFVCAHCTRPLWTFCRSTYAGADTRTWCQPRDDMMPGGWREDGTKVHLPCMDCGTDPQWRKETIDQALALQAEHGPRKARITVA